VPRPVPIGELVDMYPDLRPVVVDGLLRRGEVGNLIAAPKMRKSFLVQGLALSVATGRPWLERFETAPGKVLILDNELHGETLAYRVKEVAHGMGLTIRDVADRVHVHTLRGRLKSLVELGPFFAAVEPEEYALVILDALYRLLPAEAENDNSAIAQVYNDLDRIAARLDCAVVAVHHSSKGVQGSKSVTDVGAGAGSQSRAADMHGVIREHEEPDCAVFDAVVRSFKPVAPLGLRWSFPCWHIDPDVDVARLKRERGPGGRPPKKAVEAGDPEVEYTPETFAAAFVRAEPTEAVRIIDRATGRKSIGFEKLTIRAAERLLRLAEDEGRVHRHRYPGDQTKFYATRPQAVAETAGPILAPTANGHAQPKGGKAKSSRRKVA
jgi:hypothetical protein